MTTRPEDLRPSTGDPIPLEVLRELPYPQHLMVDGIVTKIYQWGVHGPAMFQGEMVGEEQLTSGWHDSIGMDVRYPAAPRVSFAIEETTKAISTPGDQPSGRRKSVTRRALRLVCPTCHGRLSKAGKLGGEAARVCREHGIFAESACAYVAPIWAKVGNLFLAVDKIRQKGARGLGVFRVASVEVTGRFYWECAEAGCGVSQEFERDDCSMCGGEVERFDTLAPEEMSNEGLPDMAPDEFWAMLEAGGTLSPDGQLARIAFEEV